MNDYKTEFHEAVTELVARDIADRNERMADIRTITDSYVKLTGEQPDASEIERLTDYILREELTDRNPHKVAHAEYPFMSDWQLGLRRDREVSPWLAEYVGADGINHRQSKRRMRSKHENAWMDRGIRTRNAERKAQYAKDTATVTTAEYNLRDTGGEFAPEFVACREITYNCIPEYYREEAEDAEV